MECIFCRALEDPTSDALFYEDDRFAFMMDAFPITLGHMMIFPKAHVPDPFDLPEAEFQLLLLHAKAFGQALKAQYGTEKIGLFTAGKERPDHAHIHLLPLRQGLRAHFAELSRVERKRVERDELLAEGRAILLARPSEQTS